VCLFCGSMTFSRKTLSRRIFVRKYICPEYIYPDPQVHFPERNYSLNAILPGKCVSRYMYSGKMFLGQMYVRANVFWKYLSASKCLLLMTLNRIHFSTNSNHDFFIVQKTSAQNSTSASYLTESPTTKYSAQIIGKCRIFFIFRI
jgi:hypothetical protein